MYVKKAMGSQELLVYSNVYVKNNKNTYIQYSFTIQCMLQSPGENPWLSKRFIIYLKFVKNYLIISADVSAVDTELSISEWDFTEKHNLYSGGND